MSLHTRLRPPTSPHSHCSFGNTFRFTGLDFLPSVLPLDAHIASCCVRLGANDAHVVALSR